MLKALKQTHEISPEVLFIVWPALRLAVVLIIGIDGITAVPGTLDELIAACDRALALHMEPRGGYAPSVPL